MKPSTYPLQFQVNSATVRASLSAVRHIGPHLWLGCDETATLERLTCHAEQATEHQTFQVGDFLELPSPANEEIDIEGIAYADHYLWFVGSHSLKRKSYKPEYAQEENWKRLRKIEAEENRYTLGRIPLVDGQLYQRCAHPEDPSVYLTAAQLKRRKTGNDLTRYLAKDPYLGDFLDADIPGKDNGLDIEGLAVMGDRLLLGLRGPVLRGWAVLLEIQLEEEAPGSLKLQKIGAGKERYIKHFVDLEGLGVRDLCPWQDQLLILAGPTMDLDGPLQIFTLPWAAIQSGDRLLQPARLLALPMTPRGDRAEGITLLQSEQPELLVVYDAPTAERLQGPAGVLADRVPLPQA